MDQLTEITAADYQMAVQVAETHKNEEDAASLTLSGAPLDDYTMLQNTTKVDLRKSLTELTAAMQKTNLWHTKALVDFEKATVDTYRITNGGQELPLVPGNIRNMLRDFTLGDLRDLLSIFGNLEALTSSSFHRILESYGLATKKLQHEKILAAEHEAAGRHDDPQVGGRPRALRLHLRTLQVPLAQAATGGQVHGACGKTGSRIHKMKDMGMTQEVDGVTWKLMITDKGVTWKIQPQEGETPDEEQEANMKAAASINVADFSAPLKQPQINTEVSYSDLVPKKPTRPSSQPGDRGGAGRSDLL